MTNQSNIRNFCIVAHIDHGKSTLADRLLEYTGTIQKRDMQAQLLDSNPIERERGITIKLAPVRMLYQVSGIKYQQSLDSTLSKKNMTHDTLTHDTYVLNLIDTPGHVDFNYEVSRSLAACEGAILVVDATQGVQAQTLANLNLARKQNLVVIPVLNKIDLPNAQIERSLEELRSLGFRKEDVIPISAKLGTNIDQVLEAIIKNVPAPKGDSQKPLRALVFSSQYDTHKGVVIYVRVVDGMISQESKVHSTQLKFMASGMEINPIEVGYFIPIMRESEGIKNGEVGYIATGLKDIALAKVGDTVTKMPNDKLQMSNQKNKFSIGDLAFSINLTPLPGYKEPKPMVFLGLYPIQNEDINEVRDALGKLRLSDSAFTYKPIHSQALGNGFHCGFLGLLHAEVVQERLTREFNLHLLATSPTVEYLVKVKPGVSRIKYQVSGQKNMTHDTLTHDTYITIQSAAEFPDPSVIEETREPIMQVSIFSPKDYVGAVMKLCQEKRGEYIDMEYISDQVKFTYLMPLSEMIINFFDELKSATAGYATLDYEFFDHQTADVVKLDIVLNHEKVDAFSQLVVSERAQSLGHTMTDKLKDLIPRQQFSIPVQAAIGGTIIARSDVKPFRKDVTQKLYGGDRTRKDKLLEAQKKGKKKMKMVGQVEIPQEAFLKVFKSG